MRLHWLLVNIHTPTLGTNRGPVPRHAMSVTASVRSGLWQPLPLSRAVSPPPKDPAPSLRLTARAGMRYVAWRTRDQCGNVCPCEPRRDQIDQAGRASRLGEWRWRTSRTSREIDAGSRERARWGLVSAHPWRAWATWSFDSSTLPRSLRSRGERQPPRGGTRRSAMSYPARGPANHAVRRGRWLREAVPGGEIAHWSPSCGEDRRDRGSAHLVSR